MEIEPAKPKVANNNKNATETGRTAETEKRNTNSGIREREINHDDKKHQANNAKNAKSIHGDFSFDFSRHFCLINLPFL